MNILLVGHHFINRFLFAKYFQKIEEANCLQIGTGE